MRYRVINFQQKLSLFREQWRPKVVAQMNDYQHKPCAEGEVNLLLVEPKGVANTGHEGGERTAASDVWI